MMKHSTHLNHLELKTKLGMIIILASLLLLTAGCGQVSDSGLENESDWETGQGELPDRIGDKHEPDKAVTDAPSQRLYNYSGDLWEETEYSAPTGRWFFHQGEGLLGYGLSTGTQKSGDEFYVDLFAHKENGQRMEREMRIQLTEREGSNEKKELILEEIVHVETVRGDERIYSGFLPETENVSYILSAEILNEEGEVEDTRVSFIYVPVQEMNTALSTEQDAYNTTDSKATLILDNYGPTILSFATYYTIEKKVNDTWRVVPLEIAFQEIGLFLAIGEQYEQTVDLGELNEGEYRVTKEIRADGLDLTVTLATEFTIE